MRKMRERTSGNPGLFQNYIRNSPKSKFFRVSVLSFRGGRIPNRPGQTVFRKLLGAGIPGKRTPPEA